MNFEMLLLRNLYLVWRSNPVTFGELRFPQRFCIILVFFKENLSIGGKTMDLGKRLDVAVLQRRGVKQQATKSI